MLKGLAIAILVLGNRQPHDARFNVRPLTMTEYKPANVFQTQTK